MRQYDKETTQQDDNSSGGKRNDADGGANDERALKVAASLHYHAGDKVAMHC